MRKYIILFLVFIPWRAVSQREPDFIHIFKDNKYLIANPLSLKNAKTIDTTVFSVRFIFAYQQDTSYRYSWTEEPVTLQVGRRYSKFTPDILSKIDRKYTKYGGEQFYHNANYPALWTSYYDIRKQRMHSVHRVPFTNKYVIAYQEPAPEIEWEISHQCENILGYVCRQASALFRGRAWTVWFTTEIPLNVYVWNLGGLPGLILKAETPGFRFMCQSINTDPEPIIRPIVACRSMTREKWRAFEKNYHESPYTYFNQDGKSAFYDGMVELTSNNWTIPYNPIELE